MDGGLIVLDVVVVVGGCGCKVQVGKIAFYRFCDLIAIPFSGIFTAEPCFPAC